jgi:hypothetical protein
VSALVVCFALRHERETGGPYKEKRERARERKRGAFTYAAEYALACRLRPCADAWR